MKVSKYSISQLPNKKLKYKIATVNLGKMFSNEYENYANNFFSSHHLTVNEASQKKLCFHKGIYGKAFLGWFIKHGRYS